MNQILAKSKLPEFIQHKEENLIDNREEIGKLNGSLFALKR